MYRCSAHAFDALGAMQTHALYYAPPYADRRLIFDGIRQGLRISAERPRLGEDGVSVDPTDPDLAVQTTSPGEFYKIHTRTSRRRQASAISEARRLQSKDQTKGDPALDLAARPYFWHT